MKHPDRAHALAVHDWPPRRQAPVTQRHPANGVSPRDRFGRREVRSWPAQDAISLGDTRLGSALRVAKSAVSVKNALSILAAAILLASAWLVLTAMRVG